MTTTPRTIPQHGQGSGLNRQDLQALAELAAQDGHLSDGAEVARFETEFCDLTGARNAVAVTSCTMALELTSRVLGLRAGDEVITTPLTFQATVSAYVGTGVHVRFAEIDPRTMCLDPASVERLIGPRTRAIYAVHYAGLCGNVRELAEIAERHSLRLVEDCAHAIGASVDGRSAGTFGDIGCWSFHSLKNISTLGQGGMLTVADDDLAERLRRLRSIEPDATFARRARLLPIGDRTRPTDPRRVTHEKNAFTHDCLDVRAAGLNATMSEPAATVGRSQLRRLDELLDRRRALAAILDERLAGIDGVATVPVPDDHEHARHLYAFRLVAPGRHRDAVVSSLADDGVEVVLRYFPLHLLPEWRAVGHRVGDLPTTERVWFDELVNLPLSPQLTPEDMHYMADAVQRAVETSVANARLGRSA